MSNRLEDIVFNLPKEWLDKAYEANTTGMSDGYCGSLDVIAEYIEHLEDMVKAKEGHALVSLSEQGRLYKALSGRLYFLSEEEMAEVWKAVTDAAQESE